MLAGCRRSYQQRRPLTCHDLPNTHDIRYKGLELTHSWGDPANASLRWTCAPEHINTREGLAQLTFPIFRGPGQKSSLHVQETHHNCPTSSWEHGPDALHSFNALKHSEDDPRVSSVTTGDESVRNPLTVVLPGRTVAVSRTAHLPHFLEEISHVFNAGLEHAPEKYSGAGAGDVSHVVRYSVVPSYVVTPPTAFAEHRMHMCAHRLNAILRHVTQWHMHDYRFQLASRRTRCSLSRIARLISL